jgi:uncharacterized protein
MNGIEYRVIDADSHVNEPADVWQSRVPVRLREQAPKMIETDDGRVCWSFQGGNRMHRVNTACAGVDETAYTSTGVRWDEIRPGSYDPKARVEEMELDMIQAQVLYPSLAPQPQAFGSDPELQVACVRAYNDWVHDFASYAPDRLVAMPMAPATGVEDMLTEWRRIADRGDRGYVISGYPAGESVPTEDDDRFWSEVRDWDYAVHIHFGFTSGVSLSAPSGVGYLASAALIDMGVGMYRPLADLVYSGVFERFPGLRIVAVEAGIGWIPYFLHHLDDNFLRRRFRAGVHLARMPSEYFKEQVWATFIEDPHGVRHRHEIGIDKIMWSTDYPHTNSNWPNSQRIVAYQFSDVPAEERRMIMRDNAASLYHLGE